MRSLCFFQQCCIGALLVGTFLISPSASADPAAAEALFREGRQLLAEGKTPAACEKFAASQRMDPSSGTLLNLGDCHAKQGKTATAWAEFLAASRMARNQGDASRSEEATRRAKALEGALSHVAIKVSQRVPGMQVEIDDTVVEDAALSTELPVDPGAHVIRATAAGYQAWSSTIQVVDGIQNISIPPLQQSPRAPATPEAVTEGPIDTVESHHVSTLGLVIGGVGVAATGVGAIFGLEALSTYKAAESDCNGAHTHCPSSSVDKSHSANLQANVANVAIGAGLVGIALGAYLVFKPSRQPPARVGSRFSVSPWVGAGSGGGAITGRF